MRSAIIWLLLCAATLAAEVPATAPVHSLVRVKLETGERATVLSAALVPVDSIRTYEGIAFTGPPGRYAVLVIGNEEIETKFVQITGATPPNPPTPPGPDPNPPQPDPDEPLDGVGSRLYPVILAVGDKQTAAKFATAYRSVLLKMNDGSIPSVHIARTSLVNAMGSTVSSKWKPAIDAMLKELESVVEIEHCQKVFRGTIAALELAAK